MAATFVVEDGTGLANANSFVSVAASTQYNEDHTASATWAALVQADKEKHLRLATQFIVANWDGSWRGTKANSTQALSWPRYGAHVEGYCLASNVVPTQIIHATCEAALRSMAGDTLMPDYEAGASGTIVGDRVKIGPLEFETDFGSSSSPGKTYNIINNILNPLLIDGVELIRG